MKRIRSVLRRIGRYILLFVIVPPIGLVLISGVTGLTMDVVMGPWIARLSLSSLKDLSELTKAPYRKPELYHGMEDGNAWDSYSKIASAPGNLRSMTSYLYNFRRGEERDTLRAETELAQYDSIIRFLKKGVRCRECEAPLDYRKGLDLNPDHYVSFRGITRVLATRSRVEVMKDAGTALEDMVDGIVFGQDVAGGDLTLQAYSHGLYCQGLCLDEVGRVLHDFRLEAPELHKITKRMSVLAQAQPSPLPNLEVFRCRTAFSAAKQPLFEVMTLCTREREYQPPPMIRCAVWWLMHILSWRTLFSFKWSQLYGILEQREMIKELELSLPRGCQAVDSTARKWEARYESAGVNSCVLIWEYVSPRDIRAVCQYYYSRIAEMHAAGTAALVELYFLENERWPDSLDVDKKDGLDGLLIDPFTNRQLQYAVYPGGDSVSVYSVGPNMVDDGGASGDDKDDLVLVLRSPRERR